MNTAQPLEAISLSQNWCMSLRKKKSPQNRSKKAVKTAESVKKRTQEEYDTSSKNTEILTVAKEANWLYEKFGDGEYKDILGLCKLRIRQGCKR